ncbi:hypothetical protein [Microbispora sp. ATCC PTA-5024]|uniref:hypothetical protein n=1 Tax=Microbispora sp. ATCC PTA-5024 TaxID=316330 RepID=UPI0003DD0ED7|nr:hypothetical protein [Microbispora sp. ATCC PTA-5024]ETK34973.1 hypothetical protein MPTA5024_16510 [Microbispora sp. ATCC PTA-5024]
MTRVGESTAAATLPWLVRRGALMLWHELPRSAVAGALGLAAAVPLAVAAAAGLPAWILAVTTVPPALALTGLVRFAAAVARGDGPRLAALREIDPVLALALAAGVWPAGLGLASAGAAATAGAVAAAALLLVMPYALAYGALRGRRGLGALRGGAILVAFRPSWALTLAGLGCLGGFAVAASAGVLAPVMPPLLLAIASSQVAGLLDEIDALQGRA